MLRQSHRPGEKLVVDYAGQPIPVTDRLTGLVRQAQVFVAVLGAGNYTYAEATSAQALPAALELRTLCRYHAAIRQWLGVAAFRDRGMHLATRAMGAAAQVTDHPADLINTSIEQLVKEKIELPAFSTLDRMAPRIRALTAYPAPRSKIRLRRI